MRSFKGVLLLLSSLLATVDSKLVLPSTFAPLAVFRNTNLLRSIDLTKPYSKEIIAVIVENVSKEGQREYFIPFTADEVKKVSYIEARDKKGTLGEFKVDEVEFNPQRCATDRLLFPPRSQARSGCRAGAELVACTVQHSTTASSSRHLSRPETRLPSRWP